MGKVWCRSISQNCGYPDTTERIVTDFSLSLGDTFNINHSGIIWSGSPDTLIIVDSVYYYRNNKYIRFMSPPQSGLEFSLTEPITFIEGIGPNYSLLWMRDDCSYYAYQYLLCAYKDTNKTDYVNQRYNGDCAPDLSGIADIGYNDIHIYPNPTTGYINIDGVSDLNTRYFITDILGQKLQQGNFVKNNNTIDVGNIPAGVYILDMTIGGQRIVKKFLKE